MLNENVYAPIFNEHISFNIYYFHNQKKNHILLLNTSHLCPYPHAMYSKYSSPVPQKPSAVTAVPNASELYHIVSHLRGVTSNFYESGHPNYRPLLQTNTKVRLRVSQARFILWRLKVSQPGLYEMSSSLVSNQMVGDMHRYFETQACWFQLALKWDK